jgi:hypothetical protein
MKAGMGQMNHSAAGPKRRTRALPKMPREDSKEKEHEDKGGEHCAIDEEGEMEDESGEGDHDHEADDAGGNGGEDESAKVFRNGEGRCEEVEEIAGPDVFKKSGGDALHDAGHEVPEEDGAEHGGNEVEARARDGVEVPGNESPEDDVDGDPGEERNDAGGRATQQIVLAE